MVGKGGGRDGPCLDLVKISHSLFWLFLQDNDWNLSQND